MNCCDLHTHSFYSDGTSSPKEIIEEAQKIGLCAVALCDHNTLGGLDEFLLSAENSSVEAVAGVEIMAEYKEKEVHILGLFIERDCFSPLNDFLNTVTERKAVANYQFYKNLVAGGYDISLDAIKKDCQKASPNRMHFARELMRCGYVENVKDAFENILSKDKEFYVAPERSDAVEVIKLLNSMSIVSVLAHPFLNLNDELLESFLPLAKKTGLTAMETNYTLFSEEEKAKATALADRYGLLYSGGSDYHGENKKDVFLGKGKGNLFVPENHYKKLKEYHLKLQKNIDLL